MCDSNSASMAKSPAGAAAAAVVIADAFKKPLSVAPRRKRFKKTVLDEDNYIRELEGIVERDYFPDLKRLRVQNDYLSAAQGGDAPKLHELRTRYGSNSRPATAESWTAASPDTFKTPRSSRPDSPEGAKTRLAAAASDDERARLLSLNEYLSTHTSEDNESFREMMLEARRRHRARHPWLYIVEAAHNKRQEALLEAEVPSVEEQAGGASRPGQVATWRYRTENDLMFAPKGLPLTAAEKIERARLAQEIQVSNTRFKANPFDEAKQREAVSRAAQAQARRRENKVDVDGREQAEPARRQMVRTPSPAPGVDASPLMTWGEIDGTPFRLDGGGTPAPVVPASPFRIAATSRREQLALELAERASSRHRDKKSRALEAARRQATVSPARGTLDRLASVSPAARRLARLGRSTDRALRASYTPSPARRQPAPATPSPVPAARTPIASPGPAASITDDLLRLPARQRAADFFS